MQGLDLGMSLKHAAAFPPTRFPKPRDPELSSSASLQGLAMDGKLCAHS